MVPMFTEVFKSNFFYGLLILIDSYDYCIDTQRVQDINGYICKLRVYRLDKCIPTSSVVI